MISCALTGERLGEYDSERDENRQDHQRIRNLVLNKIEELYQNGTTVFLTGCIPGADLWAAELVLEKRKEHEEIQLICVLAYADQLENCSPVRKARCRRIMEEADEQVIMQEEYTFRSFYFRSKYLVDHSNFILAICSYKNEENIEENLLVHYARAIDKKIVFLDPGI